ncbi:MULTISPECIES: MogA/MoaB family molybdenum cofactor biosynthesis protein [Geobacillus]|uniref:Molybdenum cofactor biosynthesis protein B n=1 Tax=Geobacillus thermocatenulatus TaxID=33938 RepID=A0A226QCU4_9BACL|nr:MULTISPECIES: molybdenum cofactor biosynthesis protein B [Geobacillus]KPD01392.1 Molybdenum cofactor biosynthesis protein B [Geobacillus sp. BCO2]RAN22446.1 molybdenum cofactor biosynthesis protein B [Geobacillus sp. A8]ASS98556.1 molybdenum cofactor biosynthesis protein [Geobacillus thermocatenulatus]KLR74070.1 molybdenum cofactor biosynthesis protein B [Geobacillus sp. T6]OXB89310.1 molybdenum cofactor biosynthesis protein [Geobacillus thermocatenulatus]
MSTTEHKQEAPKTVRCKIITISDTRTEETDRSGRLMIELLTEAGHEVVGYEIVKDDADAIRAAVLDGCRRPDVDAVLTNGGTGIAKRDVTVETVGALLEKELVGFGELFRFLSYTADIGPAAMLSRAVAGVAMDTAVFCTPGSTGAVRLAMTKLILPELGHVVREIRKDRAPR